MEKLLEESCSPRRMHPLNLAFVGDCVFELFVREKLIGSTDLPVKQMHLLTVKQVCCQAQAADGRLLAEQFSEEEKAIYLRGRNAHAGHLPKNATPADYHAATGLEAVFGYLYLMGRIDRLRELFEMIWNTNRQEA
jgi:ribonuclease-3 family protein